MDKPITFNEWLGTQGNMVLLHANCCRIAYEAGQQSQQAKVEELEGKLKQAYEDVDTFAEAHKRECGFKAQLAKDRAELQKRVEALKREVCIFSDFIKQFDEHTDTATIMGTLDGFVEGLEQALKGEGR